MRVLLTGATGFIGSRIRRHLTKSGHDIVCLGRRAIGDQQVTNWIVEDPTRISGSDAPGGAAFDRVYHIAAAGVDPADREIARLIDVNIHFGAQLLQEIDAAAYVFAGSSAEYATKRVAAYCESDPLQQTDLYGSSKAAGGLMHLSIAQASAKPLAHLRLFHIYGPGEKSYRLTSSLFRALKKGKRVALSSGDQVRDFVYVDDVVRAFEMAGEGLQNDALPTGAYNVCTGKGVKVRAICEKIAALIGSDKKLLGFGDLPMRPNEPASMVGKSAALEKAIDWRPTFSLAEGLRKLTEELSVGEEDET